GGERSGALVVQVSARAVGGKATEAALAAVATAFGERRSDVTLGTRALSRTKIIDVAGGDAAVLARLLPNSSVFAAAVAGGDGCGFRAPCCRHAYLRGEACC